MESEDRGIQSGADQPCRFNHSTQATTMKKQLETETMNSKSLTLFVNYRRRSPGFFTVLAFVSLALGCLSPGSAPGASFQLTAR